MNRDKKIRGLRHSDAVPTFVRWPAILFVTVTTLVLAVASGRGCADGPQGQSGAFTPLPHHASVLGP